MPQFPCRSCQRLRAVSRQAQHSHSLDTRNLVSRLQRSLARPAAPANAVQSSPPRRAISISLSPAPRLPIRRKIARLGGDDCTALAGAAGRAQRSLKPAYQVTSIKTGWGMFAPAATPRAVVDRIGKEIARFSSSPDITEQILSSGCGGKTEHTREFTSFVHAKVETARR